MDKYFMWIHYERLHNHNKAKHNKTVCKFLRIYCIANISCRCQDMWYHICVSELVGHCLSNYFNLLFGRRQVHKYWLGIHIYDQIFVRTWYTSMFIFRTLCWIMRNIEKIKYQVVMFTWICAVWIPNITGIPAWGNTKVYISKQPSFYRKLNTMMRGIWWRERYNYSASSNLYIYIYIYICGNMMCLVTLSVTLGMKMMMTCQQHIWKPCMFKRFDERWKLFNYSLRAWK